MKTKLLILLCLAIFSLNAQTTHDLNWDLGVGTSLDATIDVNDTVRWTWTDTANHSVVNVPGSTETFDSGFQQGITLTYEYTFTQVGANPYICGVHTITMGGTITVESGLGVEDFSLKSFLIKPNPSSFNLNIELPSNIIDAKVEVFDVLGKQIYNNIVINNPINISSWGRGVYLVRVSTSNATYTKRFIKQ